MKFRKPGSKILIIVLFVTLQVAFVHASSKEITTLKEYHGNFVTTVKGISNTQPPHINVLRSQEGITYLFSKFRKIRNLTTHSKARRLERELLKNDFASRMVIAVLSQPTDNYKIEKVKIFELENEHMMEVNVSYLHQAREYYVHPFKSIYYRFYVVELSDLPVILVAKNIPKKIKKQEKISFKTIYGRLQYWEDNESRLALIDKRERKKRVYYIKGTLKGELKQYVGKFIKLRGEVNTDSESVYEADFIVNKIIKVY